MFRDLVEFSKFMDMLVIVSFPTSNEECIVIKHFRWFVQAYSLAKEHREETQDNKRNTHNTTQQTTDDGVTRGSES